jgi:predicted nucleotidyltransferase
MHAIIREKIPEIARIAARRRVRRLGVFGSATSDRFDPETSDIDFVVEFEPMAPVEHAEAYFGLAEDLARLFCREIDLVERSAIRNPIFREVVEETCKDVYVIA